MFSHIKAYESKFDLAIKNVKVKVNPRLSFISNFINPMCTILHIKHQGPWPFGSGEEDFQIVFTIFGHMAFILIR